MVIRTDGFVEIGGLDATAFTVREVLRAHKNEVYALYRGQMNTEGGMLSCLGYEFEFSHEEIVLFLAEDALEGKT